MLKTKDVKELLDVLHEYEDNFQRVPKDILQITEDALCTLLEQREAAVADLRLLGNLGYGNCCVCAHWNKGKGCPLCVTCPHTDNWKWRGFKEG